MRTPDPLSKYVVTFVVAAVLLWGFGCAGERQAIKSASWSAGGAATGAALGSLAGPGGTLAGAAIGGGAGHLIGEDASLRSGELQGNGAADMEAKRWRERAIQAESATGSVASAFEAFKKFVHEATIASAAALILWLVWRNRIHIGEQGWIRGLWHGLVGGVRKAG